ncbi:syntaxin-7 [Chelonus insularis]|uniref:syntaxin-7 n=1 Tax=Chelonus insularis TaxID=460826 RepID=UPI0015884BCD|nr:syntaxin-7 [Chelonus insularis]
MAYMSQNYGSTDQRTVPDVGFSPTELYNLSENITSNIYTINASWTTLDKASKNIGTNKDNQELRDRVRATQRNTNQVVTQTSRDIARITVLMRKGDKEQKLQIEKLTTDFKDALRRYSDMQQSILQKMKRHILPSTVAMEQQEDSDGEQQGLMQAHLDDQKKAEQRELEFVQGILLEREDRIRQIEDDILDVNQIMRELGALVYQQGAAIDTIENSIENVHGNVGLGAEELARASNYQNKFRRKLCILLIIAFVALIILTIILVTKLS